MPARPGSASRSPGRFWCPQGSEPPPPARPARPPRPKPWSWVCWSCHSLACPLPHSPTGPLHRLLTVIKAHGRGGWRRPRQGSGGGREAPGWAPAGSGPGQQSRGRPWTVLADPEGNELCVLQSPQPADRLDEPGTQRGVVMAGELGVALCTKTSAGYIILRKLSPDYALSLALLQRCGGSSEVWPLLPAIRSDTAAKEMCHGRRRESNPNKAPMLGGRSGLSRRLHRALPAVRNVPEGVLGLRYPRRRQG